MWRDVLKNIQISSQRTGSKNYAEPDEEDDCVKKFYAVMEKLKNLQIDGLKKEETEYGQIFFYENGKEFEGHNNYDVQIALYPDAFGNVPNEIFCLAIEQYENLFMGGHKYSREGTFRIITERGSIAKSTSNYMTSYDEIVHHIIIAKGDHIDDSPYEATSIFIRIRKYRKGRYGEDGFVNKELVDKLKNTIDRVMVFWSGKTFLKISKLVVKEPVARIM